MIKLRFRIRLCIRNIQTPYDICLRKELHLTNITKRMLLTLLYGLSPRRIRNKDY